METAAHEFKYQKHSEKQYVTILMTAENLFIDKGIEKVSLADIANACGIMRSTFYRYFKNKDEILWHIMRKNTVSFSEKIEDRFKHTGKTTFDKFKIVLDTIYEVFVNNSSSFLFIDLFNDTYQYATSSNEEGTYNKVYKANDFRSGDAVRFLVENFHDGTVKGDLDPKTTAVTFVYSAMSIVIGMTKQKKTLPNKYGIAAEEIVKTSFNALLDSIRVKE